MTQAHAGIWVRGAARLLLWVALLLAVALAALRLAAHLREAEARDAVLPAEGRLVPTEKGAIYVQEVGPVDGAPVLLIHGSVGWAGFWGETLNALAGAGFRAIAMDMPPMGYSDRAEGADYSRATQGRRVLALVDALEARPILVAHSFGAGAGAEAVMMGQDAFAGFLVIAGAIGLGAEGRLPSPLRAAWLREAAMAASVTNPWVTRPLLAAFLYRKDAATPDRLAALNRPFRLEGTTEALADWLPTLFETAPDAASLSEEAWRGLALPVAFLWGREDRTTPLSQGARLAELVPDASLTVLDDVGHIPHIEDPAGFNAALVRALGDLTSK